MFRIHRYVQGDLLVTEILPGFFCSMALLHAVQHTLRVLTLANRGSQAGIHRCCMLVCSWIFFFLTPGVEEGFGSFS